jgi:predicted ABC-type ATPase
VPEDVIRRRFVAGLENFDRIYKPMVNSWIHYDCSGDEPMVVERGENP